MLARFDEILSVALQDSKETKGYRWTDGPTYSQCENSMPSTNTVYGGIINRAKSPENFIIQVPFKVFKRNYTAHFNADFIFKDISRKCVFQACANQEKTAVLF